MRGAEGPRSRLQLKRSLSLSAGLLLRRRKGSVLKRRTGFGLLWALRAVAPNGPTVALGSSVFLIRQKQRQRTEGRSGSRRRSRQAARLRSDEGRSKGLSPSGGMRKVACLVTGYSIPHHLPQPPPPMMATSCGNRMIFFLFITPYGKLKKKKKRKNAERGDSVPPKRPFFWGTESFLWGGGCEAKMKVKK